MVDLPECEARVFLHDGNQGIADLSIQLVMRLSASGNHNLTTTRTSSSDDCVSGVWPNIQLLRQEDVIFAPLCLSVPLASVYQRYLYNVTQATLQVDS